MGEQISGKESHFHCDVCGSTATRFRREHPLVRDYCAEHAPPDAELIGCGMLVPPAALTEAEAARHTIAELRAKLAAAEAEAAEGWRRADFDASTRAKAEADRDDARALAEQALAEGLAACDALRSAVAQQGARLTTIEDDAAAVVAEITADRDRLRARCEAQARVLRSIEIVARCSPGEASDVAEIRSLALDGLRAEGQAEVPDDGD